MKLIVLEGEYAVCRLPPTASPPAWVAQSHPFYSITRTADELSIVCRQDVVPSTTHADGESADLKTMKIEENWKTLKVQGPLVFSMTGVLSSLASPLASGGVSIFAVSTYDTDYLLVKAAALDQAIRILQDSGHEVDHPAAMTVNRPRDGPAENFELDPLVSLLVSKTSQQSLFSLCLVAGWPPRLTNADELRIAYDRFCAAVTQCWDDSDRLGDEEHPAAIYVYPFECLHVTVATFHRPGLEEVPLDAQLDLQKVWIQVVELATHDQMWPTKPFSLRIESAQIGVRAGILLWKDESGGLKAMRQCIKRAVSSLKSTSESDEVIQCLESLDIPPIVHSTFMRFCKMPQTNGAVLQRRFSEGVLSKIEEYFPERLEVPVATLVCERTPYMHIPFDDHHVIATTFFTETVVGRIETKAESALERLRSWKT